MSLSPDEHVDPADDFDLTTDCDSQEPPWTQPVPVEPTARRIREPSAYTDSEIDVSESAVEPWDGLANRALRRW